MRFSARSKVGILISLVTILTLTSAFMVTSFMGRGTASQAAHSTAHVKYHGVAHKAPQIASGRLHGSVKKHLKGTRPKVLGTHTLNKKATGSHAKVVANKNAPGATDALASPLLNSHVAEGGQLQNFNGISDLSQSVLSGFDVTPPDQGLCVGTDPLSGTTQVFEMANLAISETNPDGTVDSTSLLGPFGGIVPLQFFFAPTVFAEGDPRCFFDKSTGTFLFTEIGFNSLGDTTTDIAVFNADSNFPFFAFSVFQVDTSEVGTCFGDQPHVGLDNPNLVITTDQFCNAGYLGASVFILDKASLENHNPVVPLVEIDNVALGLTSNSSIPLTTLQPVISTDSTGTEFLVNSFPFDQFGNPNTLDNFLGFWQIDNGDDVGELPNEVTLSGKVIRSETYGFPVQAASTGSGITTIVSGIPVLSEPFLDAGDSRMMQCQLVHGAVWCSLDTAVSISHDPNTRDGIAWFKIDPKAGRVKSQGRIAATGNYLLYPAITATKEGTVAITFSITRPPVDDAGLNPSSAYVIRKSGHKSFGSIHVTDFGTDPHSSFSGPLFNRVRWGDYSAEALDPNGKDIWGATEYIPPALDQDPFDNWGTRVFDIMGDH